MDFSSLPHKPQRLLTALPLSYFTDLKITPFAADLFTETPMARRGPAK
jgi:hypothetical protein